MIESADRSHYAGTDVLHRRTPLKVWCELPTPRGKLRIVSNSRLIESATWCAREFACEFEDAAEVDWEIEVEVRSTASALDGPIGELARFTLGQSRAFRLPSGSWFAHTPPSASGVGFVFVFGNERERSRQLGAYLAMVGRFVSFGLDSSGLDMRRSDRAGAAGVMA